MRTRPPSWALALALLSASAPGCSDRPSPAAPPPSPPPSAPEPDRSTPSAITEPTAPSAPAPGARLSFPAGVLRVGSPPGRPGRDAAREADEVAVELPTIDVDRLPYPNLDGVPARIAATRAEAEALCREGGRRLCTELEWERACEGDASGARIAGLDHPEWTASNAGARFGEASGRAVIRGDASTTADAGRCAARRAVSATHPGEALAFRCCGGDAPEIPYPDEPARPTFRDVEVDDDVLRRALAQIPELARFAEGFARFDAADVDGVFVRGHVEAVLPDGVRRLGGVLEWSPAPGEVAWVFAGRAGQDAIVAVLYPMPDGSFRHAASMILEGDPLSVLFTFAPGTTRSLAWTTCYGCAGEGGEVQYRDDGRFVVVQL